jgi:ABC-type Na+ efflux pump permease subunit
MATVPSPDRVPTRADKTSIPSVPKRSISARAMDAAAAEEGSAKAAAEEEVNDAKEAAAVAVDDAAAVDREEEAADSSPIRDNGAATDSERSLPFPLRARSVFLSLFLSFSFLGLLSMHP